MAPVVLTILIAWALLSVMFLTGTLLAARSIDRSVAVIDPNVQEIGGEARFIREAKKIQAVSGDILTAAKPLSGQLAVVDETAQKGIDPRLKSINGKVGEILTVAGDINPTVLQIGSTVDSIYNNASEINTSVKSIGASVDSVYSDVLQINASADSILSDANAILSRVNSIDRAVATIVGQANDVLAVAPGIASDLNTTLTIVGKEGQHGGTIHGHANAIDCTTALNLPSLLPILGNILPAGASLTPGPYCNK